MKMYMHIYTERSRRKFIFNNGLILSKQLIGNVLGAMFMLSYIIAHVYIIQTHPHSLLLGSKMLY